MSAIRSSAGTAPAAAPPAAAATKKKRKKRRLLFVDTDSVCSFFDDKPILTSAFAQEKNQVLSALPASYREKFFTVGFSSLSSSWARGVQSRPVQILSPYSVEPGPLRRAWVDAFLERQERGDREDGASSNVFDDMPYLVYWFDKHHVEDKIESRITLIPPNEIMSYEEGVRFGFHKAAEKATPLRDEQNRQKQSNVKQALELLAEAHRRKNPCFTVRPDDKLFTLVPRSMKFAGGGAAPAPRNDDSTKQNSFLAIGTRLSVHCSVNNTYHEGLLCKQRGDFSLIAFENEEQKWIPLRDYTFKILPGEEPPSNAEISSRPLLSYRSVSVDLQSGDIPAEQLAMPLSETRRGLDPSTTNITPTTMTQPNPTVAPMANHATKTTPFALHSDNELRSTEFKKSTEQKEAISQPESQGPNETNQAGSRENVYPRSETIKKSAGKAKKQSTRTSDKTALPKTSKQKKPEGYPKQAMAAYNYFYSEEHQRIKKLISGKDLDSVENNPDSQHYISPEQIRLLTTETGKQNGQEITKFIAQNWKKFDEARKKRYNEMAAADKVRFRQEVEVFNAKKRSKSDASTTDPNKRQKTEAKASEIATKTTSGSTGSAETNKCPQTKGETSPLAAATANPDTTESTAAKHRSQPQSTAARNFNLSIMADDCQNNRKLKIALLHWLKLPPPDSDPNATEQHREFLESLLEITFTDNVKNSGIRRHVKQLRKNPNLCSISNQVLTFWNVDLETQHWKDALLNQNLDAVVDKVKSLAQYLQKTQCICTDLVERVGLHQLITDTEAFYAKRGHKDEKAYLQDLEALVGSVVN